ncbi:MAG: DUF2490 domain-containing protein [Candidatus Omnitrophica bacterium]|nr:DUF2490 domain-containing protein [Candidatus Omnitrophota bacterium]
MRRLFVCLTALSMIFIYRHACAARDWEYWNQETFTYEITDKVSFVVIPEWRFKNDMSYNYLFKLETGVSFKINKFWEITPYYVHQDKNTGALWDGSEISYLDNTFKFSFEKFSNIKLSNRLRFQYDYDKAKTIFRNSLRLYKGFKILGTQEIGPFISEEPFYDCKLDRITEHRSTVGISYALNKNISFNIGYMLNSKKPADKWTYANVLVSNISFRF